MGQGLGRRRCCRGTHGDLTGAGRGSESGCRVGMGDDMLRSRRADECGIDRMPSKMQAIPLISDEKRVGVPPGQLYGKQNPQTEQGPAAKSSFLLERHTHSSSSSSSNTLGSIFAGNAKHDARRAGKPRGGDGGGIKMAAPCWLASTEMEKVSGIILLIAINRQAPQPAAKYCN